MKVRLLNNGGFGHGDKVKFPVVVDAVRDYSNRNVYNVDIDELVRVGFNSSIRVGDDGKPFPFMADFDECELVDDMTPTQTDMERITEVETPCDITNKCCNQFGERDEMQRIINSLQADVIARGAHIKMLEDKCGELYKLAEELGACSEFLKVNFACSWVE